MIIIIITANPGKREDSFPEPAFIRLNCQILNNKIDNAYTETGKYGLFKRKKNKSTETIPEKI